MAKTHNHPILLFPLFLGMGRATFKHFIATTSKDFNIKYYTFLDFLAGVQIHDLLIM